MKLTELLTKITPLPYSVSGESIVKGDDVCIAVIEDDGGYEAPCEQREANAAYLVHAANVLPELVAACQQVVNAHDVFPKSPGEPCDCGICKLLKPPLASAENVETKQ